MIAPFLRAPFAGAMILALATASAAQVAGPVAPPPGSLGERQGLRIQYQTGMPGFPAVSAGHDSRAPQSLAVSPGDRSTQLALFDQVPYSAKAHVTVRYGASIIEQRSGPIAIGSTRLLPYTTEVVVGAEALISPVVADRFMLKFGRNSALPRGYALLLKRREAPPLAFVQGMEEVDVRRIVQAATLGLSQVDPLLAPEAAQDLTLRSIDIGASGSDHSFVVELGEFGTSPIEAVHLIIQATPGREVSIEYAGLVGDEAPPTLSVVQAVGTDAEGVTTLELRDQKGGLTRVFPDRQGTFIFQRPADEVFAATFRTTNGTYYFPAGRWLAGAQSLPAKIVLAPEYVNPGGQTNDLRSWQASVKTSKLQSLYTEFYAPHTRAWWSGAATKMTRFFNPYFHNNIGFHDIDVIPANGEQCLVGFYIGESLVEARQVRLFERSATLLGEQLSLTLQRCVIVHTIAPGKTIQSYEDILRLQGDARPQFMVFDMNPSVFMYITPIFQKHFFGYSEDQSPVAAFKLDGNNALSYLAPVPAFLMAPPLKPHPVLPSGGQLATAFILPEADAPPEANRAWKTLESIIGQYRQEFPNTLVALDGVYERARCAAQEGCATRSLVSTSTKAETSGGPTVFEERLRALCARSGAICSVAGARDEESIFRRPMIYENDFHYTRFGNAWLAQRLAQDLAGPLSRHAKSVSNK